MIKSQKLSAASAVRMPTLAKAVLYSLMTPSAATSTLTKAALVVFGSLLLAVSAQFKIPLYCAGYGTNTCGFVDWHDIWVASQWHNNGSLSA